MSGEQTSEPLISAYRLKGKYMGRKPKWAHLSDAESLTALDEQVFGDYWTLEDWQRNLQARNAVAYFIKDGDAVVAFAMYSFHAHCLRLERIAVAPRYRRQGYGAGLVRRILRKLGGRRQVLECMVPEDNLLAQVFLRATGMVCTSTVREHLVFKAGISNGSPLFAGAEK